MKQVTAYQLSDGAVYISHDAAKRAAEARYDQAMTYIRNQLVTHLDSHQAAFKATEWIEDNFLLIDGANDLKRDAFQLINEQEDD